MPGTFAYDAGTNIVTVTGGTSGSPADFASFVAADRAGAGTSLLAAWAPTGNTKALTYQVRPVELLALLISFVVAGKTAETDYIFITGTDAWGAAQTESIDVSAGNGTYVSTKRWRTITNIDCSDNPAGGGTVWANGTVAVTQPIWGVIWNLNNQTYQLDCFLFRIGNGSTSTYFHTELCVINCPNGIATAINQNCITIEANATLTDGILIDAVTRTTKNGSVWRLLESTYYFRHFYVNGTGNFYGSKFYGNGFNGRKFLRVETGLVNLYHVQFDNFINIYGLSSTSQIYNVLFAGINNGDAAIDTSFPSFASDIYIMNYTHALMTQGYVDLTFINVKAYNIATYDFYNYDGRKNRWLVNCDFNRDVWRIGWGYTGGHAYRQHTLNLQVTDKDGNSIEGAVVILKDREGIEICNVATDEDGLITFTGEDSGSVSNAVTHTDYYYSGSAQADYRGPHTLTITADGYQDYQDVITIDRKLDLEVAMLAVVASGGGVSPTNLGLVPLGIKQMAV